MAKPTQNLSKLSYCWQRQVNKYRSLGASKYAALAFLLFMFTLVPAALRHVWPQIQGTFSGFCHALLRHHGDCDRSNYGGLLRPHVLHLPRKVALLRKVPFRPQTQVALGGKRLEVEITVLESVRLIATNLLVVGGISTYIDSFTPQVIQMNPQDDPQTFCMCWQILVFIFFNEVFFYAFHRTMHHPQLYFIHKQHHEYSVTTCMAPMHNHPLEHITNILAFGLPYKIVALFYPVHMFTVLLWLILRTVETIDGHCGYDQPWCYSNLLPMTGGSNYHFFHHTNNVGNYGSISHFMDTLFGTDADFIRFKPENALYLSQQKKE